MRKIIVHLTVLLLPLLICRCEKENFDLEGRLENNVEIAPLMYDALVAESDSSYQVSQQLENLTFASQNIASVGTISSGQDGPVLYLGIAKLKPSQFHMETFPFTLKFRVDEMDPTLAPGDATLKDYFSIGREFPFGEENGQAELGILLPGGTPDDQRSRSDYVEDPEGVVKVMAIEPFLAQLPASEGGNREYLMITFSFTGKIGIHSYAEELESERLRIPYIASRIAEVTGTTTLVLAATPG